MNWQVVDVELKEALKQYNQIRVYINESVSPKKQPLFIDLIIKITVCCAYANLNNKKILTAEKILESTRCMINFVEKGRMRLIRESREEVPIIPLEILKQKYLLHKGLLLKNLNKDQDACRCFTHLMVSLFIILIHLENWRSVRCPGQKRSCGTVEGDIQKIQSGEQNSQ
jgi:hypothetical protein